MAPPDSIRFACPNCGELLRAPLAAAGTTSHCPNPNRKERVSVPARDQGDLGTRRTRRIPRLSAPLVSAAAVTVLAGILLLCDLLSGTPKTASANAGDKPPSSEEYYELAELLSENHWKVGSLPNHHPQEEAVNRYYLDGPDPHQQETIDRFNALRKNHNAVVSRLADQGLKSFFTWKYWQARLANQGFQASDLVAAQKEWARAATTMGIKGLDADEFGGELGIAKGGMQDLGKIAQMFAQKFSIDSFREYQYARYQRANRMAWENDLLRYAPLQAGPASPKLALNFYQSRSSTDVHRCLLAENVSDQDLTHCTLDVTIDFDRGLKDHSVYYLPSWHNRVVLLLQEDINWWRQSERLAGVLRVVYSLWADELRETQQTLLTETTFTEKRNPRTAGRRNVPPAATILSIPHVKVRRLSPREVEELSQTRSALVAAITRKSYIPEFKSAKKLFKGPIHFDGVTPVPGNDGKPRNELTIRLDDRRWGVASPPQLDLDMDFGYSITLGFNGPGLGYDAMQTHFRGCYGLVFLRGGELYLRADKIESIHQMNGQNEKKRQIGQPVRLRPVE